MRRGDEGERGGAGVKKHGAYGGVCMHACACVCVFWGMCVGGVVTHFLGCSDKAGETAGDGHERRRRRRWRKCRMYAGGDTGFICVLCAAASILNEDIICGHCVRVSKQT